MSGRVCLSGRRRVCVATLVATMSLIATPRAWATPTPTRVSVDVAATQGDGNSRNPSVTSDGRYVAFESRADNLIPGDTNGFSDIFVKDRWTGAIERVSVKSDGSQSTLGDSFQPQITPDGRFVVFASAAPLSTFPENHGCPNHQFCAEIYLHDRTTHETTVVSVPASDPQSDGTSTNPSISADGRYITFLSTATNLIPGGTDVNPHVFLRDRIAGTTAWIDRRSNGLPGIPASGPPVISSDGSTVAFTWYGPYGAPPPGGDAPCNDQPAGHCIRVFLFDRPSATLSRLALPPDRFPVSGGFSDVQAITVALSADGRRVATALSATKTAPGPVSIQTNTYAVVQDRVSGHVINFSLGPFDPGALFIGLDAAGRMLASCGPTLVSGGHVNAYFLVDLVDTTGAESPVNGVAVDCQGLSLSGNGQVLTLGTAMNIISGDTNALADVYAYDLDTDRDGIPDAWETLYGLNPSDPADAALDPDGDGKSNLEEYRASTHPRGAFTRYLAEGATNSFFATTIGLFNPSDTAANVLLRYLGDSGAIKTLAFTVAAKEHVVITPDGSVPDPSFSTVIESDRFVAAERTMRWGDGSYGSHAETAVAQPSTTWYFAEGATHGSFDLFYLLQNPNDTTATVTITYLLPAGQPPIVRDYVVAAHSRRTIYVDQEPGLDATDVSAQMVSDVPILAERSMYFSTPDQPFAGGTGGAGLPQPATSWFVAEGATGSFFDTYILIGNPSAQDAAVTVTYLLEGGVSFDKQYVVAKQSRLTISVKGEDPRLASTSVSSVVKSTNAVPIVVERAMWWPSPNWYEGHLTAATTETATTWAMADGVFGPSLDAHTYLLVANPTDTLAHVTFALHGTMTFNGTSTTAPVTCDTTIDVAPHSRYTADATVLCQLDGVLSYLQVSLGGLVTSSGPGIVVERSTYRSAGTQFWASGESTALTKVPLP